MSLSKGGEKDDPQHDHGYRDDDGDDDEQPRRHDFRFGKRVHDALVCEGELALVAVDGIDGYKGDDEANDQQPVKDVRLPPTLEQQPAVVAATHILRGLSSSCAGSAAGAIAESSDSCAESAW